MIHRIIYGFAYKMDHKLLNRDLFIEKHLLNLFMAYLYIA